MIFDPSFANPLILNVFNYEFTPNSSFVKTF